MLFRSIGDSLAIANYLEETYPNTQSLFGRDQGRALTQFVQNWVATVLHIGVINLILLDIFVYGRRAEPFYERARAARGKP